MPYGDPPIQNVAHPFNTQIHPTWMHPANQHMTHIIDQVTVDQYGNTQWQNIQPISKFGNINPTFDNDITWYNNEGRLISARTHLQKIVNALGLIDPDYNLIEKYPAVKEAYKEYEHQLEKAFKTAFPELYIAIESYKTIVALVKIDNDE